MFPRQWLVMSVIGIIIVSAMTPALADNAEVSDCVNFTGVGSLSEAVDRANMGGGVITFSCSGVINVPSVLIITDAVTINGGDAITLYASTITRLFSVTVSGSLTLNDITLENGSSYNGSAVLNGGNVSINNSIIRDHDAFIGGALYNFGGAMMTVTATTFSDNLATGDGGVIFNDASTIIITDSTFNNHNAVNKGGAIFNTGTLTITDSTFGDNSAGIMGGAIMNSLTGTITLNHAEFTTNTAPDGGAIFNEATLTITNSTFTDNVGNGGALYTSGTANSQDSHYHNNGCVGSVNDLLGNTAMVATGCLGGTPIGLDVGVLMCSGNNLLVLINAGDANFDIRGDGINLPIENVPTGSYIALGAGTWTDVIVRERRGEREGINLGGITCPTGVIIPPSIPVPSANAITSSVSGCALNTTAGIQIEGAPDDTYCRVLMRNGSVVSYSGAIPSNLVGLGVKLAVDVYRLEGGQTINTFPSYTRVCLAGQGRLFYMDGRNAPRYSVEMPIEVMDTMTCAWIPAPGTLILTND